MDSKVFSMIYGNVLVHLYSLLFSYCLLFSQCNSLTTFAILDFLTLPFSIHVHAIIFWLYFGVGKQIGLARQSYGNLLVSGTLFSFLFSYCALFSQCNLFTTFAIRNFLTQPFSIHAVIFCLFFGAEKQIELTRLSFHC